MDKEYIERETAINELKCLPEQGELDYLGVFDCVKSVPAADVEPVVHGEWIYDRTYYEADECHCSLCNQLMTTARGIRMKYCPNCGARMDGGKR